MTSTNGLQELRGSQSGQGPPELMLCIAVHGTYSTIIALKTSIYSEPSRQAYVFEWRKKVRDYSKI
jgi:hypothetical protein